MMQRCQVNGGPFSRTMHPTLAKLYLPELLKGDCHATALLKACPSHALILGINSKSGASQA